MFNRNSSKIYKDEILKDSESFDDKEKISTPRGSIHTNKQYDTDQNTSNNFNQIQGFGGNNKIRVVIRMRPYLENEQEELRSMSNALGGG